MLGYFCSRNQKTTNIKENDMNVIMMESGAYQELIDRIERIEKYVVKTTERQAALDDENVWLDNDQVCKLLDVSPRSLQRYRSDGKLPYMMYGKKCRYRLSDVEKLSGINFKAIGMDVADEVATAYTRKISNIINNKQNGTIG